MYTFKKFLNSKKNCELTTDTFIILKRFTFRYGQFYGNHRPYSQSR